MKPLVVAVLLIALVAGAALAAILSGGDEPVSPAATTSTAPSGDTTGATAPAPDADRSETERTRIEPTASPRDEQAIERAVIEAAEAAEAGVLRPGIEPGDLPGTDELSIDSVSAKGPAGSARLSSGAVVKLRRERGRWRVVAVEAPG